MHLLHAALILWTGMEMILLPVDAMKTLPLESPSVPMHWAKGHEQTLGKIDASNNIKTQFGDLKHFPVDTAIAFEHSTAKTETFIKDELNEATKDVSKPSVVFMLENFSKVNIMHMRSCGTFDKECKQKLLWTRNPPESISPGHMAVFAVQAQRRKGSWEYLVVFRLGYRAGHTKYLHVYFQFEDENTYQFNMFMDTSNLALSDIRSSDLRRQRMQSFPPTEWNFDDHSPSKQGKEQYVSFGEFSVNAIMAPYTDRQKKRHFRFSLAVFGKYGKLQVQQDAEAAGKQHAEFLKELDQEMNRLALESVSLKSNYENLNASVRKKKTHFRAALQSYLDPDELHELLGSAGFDEHRRARFLQDGDDDNSSPLDDYPQPASTEQNDPSEEAADQPQPASAEQNVTPQDAAEYQTDQHGFIPITEELALKLHANEHNEQLPRPTDEESMTKMFGPYYQKGLSDNEFMYPIIDDPYGQHLCFIFNDSQSAMIYIS